MSEDILLKVLACTNSSAETGPLLDSTLTVYDTSHIIEISLGFLGKALDDQSNTSNRRKSNRAFNHFAHRPKSSCGYDISSVCNSDVTDDCAKFSTFVNFLLSLIVYARSQNNGFSFFQQNSLIQRHM